VRRLAAALGNVQRSGSCHATQSGGKPRALQSAAAQSYSSLIDDFTRHRESIDLFSPVLEQAVLAEFLRDGHFGRHLRRMRALYEKRRDALVRGLREHAGTLVPHNSDAGLHVSAFLPDGIDDRVIVREAALRGVEATALSTCYVGDQPRSGLVLGFGGASERRIIAACKVLGEVLSTAPRN
jgi:GntR family transcriptional regulator/MocR family aminotransferase